MQQLDLLTRLQHVVNSCEAILAMTDGKSFDDYEQSLMLRWAVERQFTIIGEALRYAAQLDPTLPAKITDYRRIRDFRNVLIHDYVQIYDEAVWLIIHTDLPRLLAEIQAILGPE